MQREFRRVNARHSAIRRGLVDPEGLRSYVEKLGEAGVEQILASGIAGVSPTKTGDLKCLHAHLADYLCTRRGGGEGKGWGRGGAMLRAKEDVALAYRDISVALLSGCMEWLCHPHPSTPLWRHGYIQNDLCP